MTAYGTIGDPREAFSREDSGRATRWDVITSATTYVVRFLVGPVARVMRDVTAGRASGTSWQELVNKTDVITAVDSGPRDPGSLAHLLRDTNRYDAFIRLWVIEGLGRQYIERLLQQNRPLTFRTTMPACASPGERAMLHAGMGMALAIAFLNELDACRSSRGVEIGLDHFVRTCRRASQRGYAGAAIESLGLVVRFLRSDLVGAIDRLLCDIDPEAIAYLWHGAGRAIYFLPENMAEPLTGSRSDVRAARKEPPHALGRANALAGWAWAVFLVNSQHPAVIDAAFRHCQPDEAETLAYAVRSAVRIRQALDRTDRSIAALLLYQPMSNLAFVNFWTAVVRRPVARGLRSGVDDPERLYRIDLPNAANVRRACGRSIAS